MKFDYAFLKGAALAASIAVTSAVLGGAASAQSAPAGSPETYLVVYKSQSLPTNTAQTIKAAGGTVLYTYPQIGVVVAQSSSSSFRTNLMKNTKIMGVSSTSGFAVQSVGDASVADSANAPPEGDDTPASDSDSLSGLQWDMVQIKAPEAHAITGGSPSIIVGVIDSGLDYTHPDLAANVDVSRSASCLGGFPDTNPAAWMDDHGHGTHTAGTIAAASNGIGIVGVAPNVKIAGIKAANANGFFYPEAVVCAFMWAATKGIHVTNNSYFVDPWLFNCKKEPVQRAIWNAVQRAILYAQSKGMVVVSAMGNQADDLQHPTQDVISPDDTTPIERVVNNSCAVIPVEIQGVVGVSATGSLNQKSYYSNYGSGKTNVAAPGGDRILQTTAAAPNGRVLSTWPSSLLNVTCAPALSVEDASGATYCYLQGTSMASPHVAGLAALIRSRGTTSRGAIISRLQNTADPIACPEPDVLDDYAPFPSFSNGAPQTCSGGDTNSWYGHGQVNALSAVE